MHPVDFKYFQIGPQCLEDEYVYLRPVSGLHQKDSGTDADKDSEVLWKTSWPVAVLWVVLSALVTVTCTGGFVETEWFVRENGTNVDSEKLLSYDRNSLTNALGMLSVCHRANQEPTLKCTKFGNETPFPSGIWQTAGLFYGVGCVLQGCGLLILLLCVSLGGLAYRKLAANMVSHIHVIAGLLQTLGLFVFPIILETEVARLYCGAESRAYSLNDCRVGWAYVASTGGTLLTFYCPFLAYFSVYKVYRHPGDEYWIF